MNFLTKVNLNKNIEGSEQFCKFDFDPVPEVIEKHLKLSGWVVGIESPVVGIELIQDGQLLWESPLTINRSLVYQTDKTVTGEQQCGFSINLALENINLASAVILIQAVFEDFKRIPLADLNLSIAEESNHDLAQVQAELHNTREELERLQSQFDEVLAELEQTHWQLHQIQTKQSDSAVIVDSDKQVIEVNPDDIQSYYRFLEVQPDNLDIWLQLANILVEQNRLEDAIAAYRRLVELSPCEEYYQQLGQLLVKQEKWDDAIIAYRGAIEFNPEDSLTYCRLGQCLAETGELDDAVVAFEMSIKQNVRQNDTKNCNEEQFFVLQNSIVNAVIDSYNKAFQHSAKKSAYYYQLGMYLAQNGLMSKARECFQQAPQIRLQKEQIFENIWKGLNQLGFLDETNPQYPEQISLEETSAYFNPHQYKIINFWELTDDDKNYLEQAGLSLANLELIGSDNKNLEEIYVNQINGSNDYKIQQVDIRKPNWYETNMPETAKYFHHNLVATGYVYSICPSSGRILKCNQSFHDTAWLPIISYRFVGSEVFYLLVGHNFGGKLSIYFPRLELIIKLSPINIYGTHEGVVNRLKICMVTYWKAVKSYITTEAKSLAVVIGGLNQIAHYFWNEVPAIQYLYDHSILEKVDKVIIKHNFFQINDIYPEITNNKIVQMTEGLAMWETTLFQTIINNNYFAARIPSLFIPDSVAKRIYQAALKRCSNYFLDQVNEAKQCFPLLWVGLRVHNRVWQSQVEGIANIISKIYNDFPNMGVVFVGCSKTDEEGNPAGYIIEAETSVYKQIDTLLPENIFRHNAIGAPIHETIIWSFNIDIYTSTVGSGEVFPLWIAHKPGVCHGLKELCGEDQKRQHSEEVAENAISTVFIPDNDLTGDGSPVRNYNCDWEIIYEELLKVIKGLQPFSS
jgi:tetratricopeptide (TPR) repeat protein